MKTLGVKTAFAGALVTVVLTAGAAMAQGKPAA